MGPVQSVYVYTCSFIYYMPDHIHKALLYYTTKRRKIVSIIEEGGGGGRIVGSIQNNTKINRMAKNDINGRFLNHGNLCMKAGESVCVRSFTIQQWQLIPTHFPC